MEVQMKQDDFDGNTEKWVCNTARKIPKGDEADPVSRML